MICAVVVRVNTLQYAFLTGSTWPRCLILINLNAPCKGACLEVFSTLRFIKVLKYRKSVNNFLTCKGPMHISFYYCQPIKNYDAFFCFLLIVTISGLSSDTGWSVFMLPKLS
jgi:hypothetical protein